jgi:hypothetical protein
VKTIAQRWAEAERVLAPEGCHPIQRQETRRAFYMGFWASLQAGLEMATESGDNDDIGATMIERMHQECRDFMKAVTAGKA